MYSNRKSNYFAFFGLYNPFQISIYFRSDLIIANSFRCRWVFNAVGQLPFTKAHGKFPYSSIWTVCFACGFVMGVVLAKQGSYSWQSVTRWDIVKVKQNSITKGGKKHSAFSTTKKINSINIFLLTKICLLQVSQLSWRWLF